MRGQWKQWAAVDLTVIQQSSEENIANGYKKKPRRFRLKKKKKILELFFFQTAMLKTHLKNI